MEVVRKTAENVLVLTLTGRFDAHEKAKIASQLEDAAKQPGVQVLVNMSGVNFIDSTGLSSLVQGMKHCRQQKGNLSLCALQQPVRIIFELTRLDRAFDIYQTEEEALTALFA